MQWPTVTDYHEAIQSPQNCFYDSDLRSGSTVTDSLGLPKVASGNFAVVYQIACASHKYAVRCFHRHPRDDQEQRYGVISKYLYQNKLPYMAEFVFQAQGIRIRGKWYPILKMEWIEGELLNQYIDGNLNNPNILRKLAQDFCQLISDLRSCSVAHCDLQHGNILVVNGKLRLIDYDGMFVPGLSNMLSNELGHPNFQHPARSERYFNQEVDNFSSWVILLSILALSKEPSLWRKLNAGDESLLFQKADFENPTSSKAFHALDEIDDQEVRSLVRKFRSFINCSDIAQIPSLPNLKPPEEPHQIPASPPLKTPDISWVLDHIPIQSKVISSDFYIERSILIGLAISILAVILINTSGLMPLFTLPIFMSGIIGLFSVVLFRRFRSIPEVMQRFQKANELKSLDGPLKGIQRRIKELEIANQQALENEARRKASIEQKLEKLTEAENKELEKIDSALRKADASISSELREISNQENEQIAAALRGLQNSYIASRLSNYRIDSADIHGIGTVLTLRLNAAGIRTAGDIRRVIISQGWGSRRRTEIAYIQMSGGQKIHVNGIGPQKAREIGNWRQKLELQFRSSMPQHLPSSEESAIRSRYQVKRQSYESQKKDAILNAEQSKNVIRTRYQQDQSGLSRDLQDSGRKLDALKQEIEINMSNVKKELREKQWPVERAKRELDAYSQVNFTVYLKRAILWWIKG